jgi:uncharacterized protein
VQYPQYDPLSPLTPLTADELQALDQLLQGLPADQAMGLDGMDGYLTAFAIGPAALRALPTGDWLPALWGGDPDGPDAAAPFASKRQRKNTVVLALRHLRHLHHQLHQAVEDWEPIFSVAERGADEWTDAREWCMGFLQAVDLLPDAWGGVWSDATLAAVLRPVLLLGGGLDGVASPLEEADGPDGPDRPEGPEDIDDLHTCDALSRCVPDAVLQLMASQNA